MNKQKARRIAQGLVLTLIAQEHGNPTSIMEGIIPDYDEDDLAPVYDALRDIYWQLKERWPNAIVE